MRTLKTVHQIEDDKENIILRSKNPQFKGDTIVPLFALQVEKGVIYEDNFLCNYISNSGFFAIMNEMLMHDLNLLPNIETPFRRKKFQNEFTVEYEAKKLIFGADFIQF